MTFDQTIHIPLAQNPLSLNKKLHWAAEAKLTKQWRKFAYVQAARFPELGRCDVTLTWHVTDNRRRDEDNMAPLLKALCDGLVDAGVVLDDTPIMMGKNCRIVKSDTAHMELRVVKR